MHPLSLTNESNRERCLDPQLWHACAGGMIQMPPLNSKVFYFPQGHAEHATGNNNVDFGDSQVVPSLILCTVSSISYMADPDTDEVFAKIILVPVKSSTHELDIINGEMMPQLGSDMNVKAAAAASFAKTLTQSDANNGGGFSVPRYCAETIFPRLDYCAEPPVQTIVAKDVHGQNWKFRHIYRGTPRRHLLTTGWSNFVNQKKLVTGDSIVFLRAENGDLCVGIRRAKKGPDKYGSGWNNFGGYYGGSSSWLLPKKSVDGYKNNVTSESVVRAASLAATGQPFEVVYYPRGSTPEFFVKASSVSSAMRTQWCSGMRFKMPFETEDSSRISWFMGTISSVQVADPILWPNSPWRLLQVAWDEPDLLQNVKRVNPWLVELVSTVPSIHLISPFPPPRKKLCVPVHPNNAVFPLIGVQHNSNPLCLISQNNPTLLSIQGARHIAHYQHTLSPPHAAKYHKLQSSGSVPQLIDYSPHHHQFPNAKFFINNNNDSSSGDNISCFDLTMGTPPPPVPTRSNFKDCSGDKKKSSTPHHILLFGQFIFTENNNNHTNSQYSCSSQSQGENNTDGHHKTSNSSGGSHQTSPAEELSSSEEQLFPVAAEEMLSLGSTLYRETNHLGN